MVTHETVAWPAYREILCFHRPVKPFTMSMLFSPKIVTEIENDMLRFGYLLPDWIPLLTRHMCMSYGNKIASWPDLMKETNSIQPFRMACVGKNETEQGFPQNQVTDNPPYVEQET